MKTEIVKTQLITGLNYGLNSFEVSYCGGRKNRQTMENTTIAYTALHQQSVVRQKLNCLHEYHHQTVACMFICDKVATGKEALLHTTLPAP